MTSDLDHPSLRSRLEVGRLLVGSLLELGIKAYGAGAAVSVAMSDAETVGGKARDAIAAVPTLAEEYRQAKYVVDHREEIRAAIDYVNTHTLPQEELEQSADQATATLRDLETTYDELSQAQEGLSWDPRSWDVPETFGHVRAAWEARPELDSIAHLADTAERVSPFVDQVEVLVPVYYGGLVAVMDNFAGDEVVGTLVVMAVAFGLAVVLGQAVGFWVRRGRPGLVARVLQRWGARTFRGWYVRNLPQALGPELHTAARERIQRDIVADPENALDPDVLRRLELYFEDRARGRTGGQ